MGCHQGKASALSGPDDAAKTLLGNQETVKTEATTGQALSSTMDADSEQNQNDVQAQRSATGEPHDAMTAQGPLRQGDAVVVDGRSGKVVCNPFGDNVDSPVLVSFEDGGSSYVSLSAMTKTGSAVPATAPTEESAVIPTTLDPVVEATEESSVTPVEPVVEKAPPEAQPCSNSNASKQTASDAIASSHTVSKSEQRAAEATATPVETKPTSQVDSSEKPGRKEKCTCCC
jgi:hypothetical protein